MSRVKRLAMRDNTPRPMIPSVSPLIRAAPDATSRICSTLWTRVPSGEPGAARWCVGTGLGCDTLWSLRSPLLKLLACCRLLFLRMRKGYGQTLHTANTHTLLCNVWDVIENLLNYYLSLQQTLSRYYQSRSQCGQLYEVLWTFPGPPSSGWWCGTWEHPLLHLIPESGHKVQLVCAKKTVTSRTALKLRESTANQNLWSLAHDMRTKRYLSRPWIKNLFPQHSN